MGKMQSRAKRFPRFSMSDHDEMTGASAWDEWQRRHDRAEWAHQSLINLMPAMQPPPRPFLRHNGQPPGTSVTPMLLPPRDLEHVYAVWEHRRCRVGCGYDPLPRGR